MNDESLLYSDLKEEIIEEHNVEMREGGALFDEAVVSVAIHELFGYETEIDWLEEVMTYTIIYLQCLKKREILKDIEDKIKDILKYDNLEDGIKILPHKECELLKNDLSYIENKLNL